jgi:cell fate regulator YaaT (PSP1 superfamily)
MSDQDSYEDIIEDEMDEDISSLEDKPQDEETSSIITGEDLGSLNPDTPVYRLRLVYSNETFLAVWPGEALLPGGMVVLPTRYGRDLAQVIGLIQKHGQPLGEFAKIDRPAGSGDLEKAKAHKEQEKEALRLCKEKIKDHRLEMKLVSVHYLLEESKILFFFTAESRVDFRELVKDLVSIFKSRIELRQIGVRDESRVVGGLGVCGRGYCCHAVSDKLKPVSIKMAKDKNLTLNSMKISGPCGRLLCCLAYEHLFYNEQRRVTPQEGCKISFDGDIWKVTEVNVVLGKLKLVTEDGRYIQLPASAFEKTEGRWSVRPGSTAL